MPSFGIEFHVQLLFQCFLLLLLGALHDVFPLVEAPLLQWRLIHRHHTRIDGAILPEKIRRHHGVVKLYDVVFPERMKGHLEVEHPSCVGPQLVKARVEGIGQREIAATVALVGDDQLLPLHHHPVGRHQLNIEYMAHVGIFQVVSPHHIGFIPDGVAFEIAVVVKVEIHLLLYGILLHPLKEAVKPVCCHR